MRPAQLDIAIPDFPTEIEWINAQIVRVGTLLGRHAVLVWFWDYCSLNALRSLPYVREWDRRYRGHGLSVFGIHSPQFAEWAVSPDGDKAVLDGAKAMAMTVLDLWLEPGALDEVRAAFDANP